MTTDTRNVVASALANYRGDDYERAKAAFRGCTPAQMQEVWSGNGETRQQVLDGYRQHVEAVERAWSEIVEQV